MPAKTLPKTKERAIEHTAEKVNEQIERQLEANVQFFARRIDEIEKRLEEIDYEWDIERTLETNAAAFSLLGLGLGLFWKKWNLLPMIISGFLLQHALQGWCPSLPVFRRLGLRTVKEIDKERYALKALRGDFVEIDAKSIEDPEELAEKALEAAE